MNMIHDLRRITETEFSDIVSDTIWVGQKLRILLKDNSFIDVNLSQTISNRLGFHWEHMDAKGTIFRYDNFPDIAWTFTSTFPFHIHDGSQHQVKNSPFPHDLLGGFRGFMEYVRNKIKESSEN